MAWRADRTGLVVRTPQVHHKGLPPKEPDRSDGHPSATAGLPLRSMPEVGARVTTRMEFHGLDALTLRHAPATVTLPSERPPKALRQLKETRRHRPEQSSSTPGTNTGWTGVCPVAP
jgi:hypothetical protein